MKRYAQVPWPWIGIFLALGAAVQALLAPQSTAASTLGETAYRIVAMSIGVSSLVLLFMPPRRIAYFTGALVAAGLVAWALYLQYVVGLDPCPLCSVQRMVVIALGVICVVAAFQNPRRGGATFYALIATIVGGFGILVAMRHVWIQALPKGEVPSCGMSLNYMLDTLPFSDVLDKLFHGGGECAEEGWKFLQLAIPSWTLVFFVAMVVGSIALVRRD